MTSPAVQQAPLTARRHADRVVRERLAVHGIHHEVPPAPPFRLRLWLPTSLLWIFFPLIILASPLALAWRASPSRFIAACAALLAGLSGALVEVETSDADIHIRLF